MTTSPHTHSTPGTPGTPSSAGHTTSDLGLPSAQAPATGRLLPLSSPTRPAAAPARAAVDSPSPVDAQQEEPQEEQRAARRAVLARRIRWFVAATITYNVIEAVVALSAGTKASSGALIGFGLDSVIEVSSAAAVAWQFSARDHEVREAREHRTLRIIAVSFFALAAYVIVDSVRGLFAGAQAETSIVGIVLAAASLAIMPVLSAAQRRTGRELGSATAVADSKQTLLCTYLSAVLLVGLVLNATLGWSWADPIAALVIAAVAIKEGLEAWRGDDCCSPASALALATNPATNPAAGSAAGSEAASGCGCGDDCCGGR